MRPCCEVPENLSEPQTPIPDKLELTVRVCGRCGAKHYQLDADALELGVFGAELG